MSKDKPRNLAASVRHRLTELARKQGEDFQFVLTRYVIERLLYRLSRSPYRDEFVLKGAMLFRVWTNQIHRPNERSQAVVVARAFSCQKQTIK